MNELFLFLSVPYFFVFGLLWEKKTFVNLFLKVFHLIMAIFGIILLLLHFGFVIKQ